MKTFKCVQVIAVQAATFGLLMSIAGCGADASDRTNAQSRAAGRVPGDRAPVASNEVESQRAAQEPTAVVRRASAPNDPTVPRPSTKEACDACQGIWAVQGIESEESCICKTNDEGRACVDGKDCQGECLLDGDAEFHVMEHSDPPRGYYRGHCAGYDLTFGCFRHIADDIGNQLPLTAEEAGEDVCVD